MCILLKKQFKLQNLVFYGCSEDRFYRTEWSEKYRELYLLWRFFLLAYWISWFATSLAVYDDLSTWWMKLTHWGIIVSILYYGASFAVCAYGICSRRRVETNTPNNLSSDENRSDDTSKVSSDKSQKSLRWFHILVWILFELSIGVAFIITITYWILLNPKYNAFSINHHLINSVLLILDLGINAIPIRILHFYILILFSTIYSLFSFTLYITGYKDAIYSVLNWKTNFTRSLLLAIGVSLIGAPIVYFMAFLLYSLKKVISNHIKKKNVEPQTSSQTDIDQNSPVKVRRKSSEEINSINV